MKKFFLLFMMAVMTAVAANAQTSIPSDAVFERYRKANANVLIGFYTEASFCNDLVFAGTYNNWNVAEVDSLVHLMPVDSFPNWFVCSLYDDGTFDYGNGICGKVVALRADGAFEWGCQWDSDVQLLRGNALLYEELPGEMMLRDIDTSAPVVLSSSKWKGGADPCALKQTYTVYLDAPSCADAEGNTFQPAVCGDFTGWGELIPMTQLASGSSCMCTFEAYPGQTFRFVAMGEWVDWDNQLQYYSATEGAWVDAPIITLDTMSQLSYDYSEGRYGYCVNVPTPEPEPVNYSLRTVAGVPVVADSMRTNIAARAEMFVIGFEGYESGDLWFGTPVVEYGSELCAVTAKLNLYTAATSSYLCLMEFQSFATGGRFGGHVTLYAQALDPASGRVLHSDSLVVPFSGFILGPEPEPEPEYEAPSIAWPYTTYGYYPGEQIELASCRVEDASRSCRVEWGWVENYVDREKQPWLPDHNSSDITKQAVYHFLKEDTAYTVESDPTSVTYNPVLVLKSEFNPGRYTVALDEYFYCRVYQGDKLLDTQVFKYENAYEIRRISIEINDMEELFRAGDTVNHFAIVGVIEGPESIGREGRINFYNALDTAATTPVSVFQNGNTYYAQLETPFDSLFAPQSVLTKNTMIAWYGGAPEWLMLLESTMGFGTPYDMSGRLRSPLFTVDEVSWYAAIIKEGDGIMVVAGMVFDHDAVVIDTVRMEMSLDGDNWIPLSGDNIEVDGEDIYAYLESMAFRAGTYYFRFVGVTSIGTFTSDVYTVVIGGGINIDLENVAEGAVEYDAETNTVTISGAVIENVVTALTNMEADATISLEGSTTIVAEETGILTSGDITIVGSYGEGYVSTDTMTITAPRPLVASAEGVKLTLDGVTLHLVNPNPPVPGEAAARRQLSPIARARYIAKTVLLTHNAEDESVISGFDEVDFINCGVIEPEGAEYDEENMELMSEGEPVYNCTIAPMETPVSEAIESVEAEKVSTDKQLRQGAIYILRQNRVYTVMGQLVK